MGETRSGRFGDTLKLVAIALVVSGLLLGVAFLFADYNLPIMWLMGVGYASIFTFGVVKFARSKFRQPLFIPFFLLGLAGQVAASLWAAWRVGFVAVLFSMVFGFFIFITLTIWLFGPIKLKNEDASADVNTRTKPNA